jgi:hypothetical protein
VPVVCVCVCVLFLLCVHRREVIVEIGFAETYKNEPLNNRRIVLPFYFRSTIFFFKIFFNFYFFGLKLNFFFCYWNLSVSNTLLALMNISET